MKPEIYEQWEEILSDWRKVEELVKDEKLEEAAPKAIFTVLSGVRAIKALSDEHGNRDLSVIAENAFGEWWERRKHYTPKENIDWARKTLTRLSEDLPPDTLRPLK